MKQEYEGFTYITPNKLDGRNTYLFVGGVFGDDKRFTISEYCKICDGVLNHAEGCMGRQPWCVDESHRTMVPQ